MSDFQTRLKKRILALLESSPERPASPPLKPDSELSRDEIAQELWCRGLTFSYTQHQEYFDRWWKLLTPKEREWLSVAAECFPSYAAWLRALMRVSNCILSDDAERAVVRHIRYKLSRFNLIVKDRHGAVALREALSKMISSEFGLEDGRPIENQDRDRMWSQLRYQGWPYKGIAKFADESTIRKAIKVHRKRNTKLIWALRVAIFVTGFPAPDSMGGVQPDRKQLPPTLRAVQRGTFPEAFWLAPGNPSNVTRTIASPSTAAPRRPGKKHGQQATVRRRK